MIAVARRNHRVACGRACQFAAACYAATLQDNRSTLGIELPVNHADDHLSVRLFEYASACQTKRPNGGYVTGVRKSWHISVEVFAKRQASSCGVVREMTQRVRAMLVDNGRSAVPQPPAHNRCGICYDVRARKLKHDVRVASATPVVGGILATRQR